MKLPPFPVTCELVNGDATTDFLQCQITGPVQADPGKSEIETFLSQELHTPILTELYPHLWHFATKSSKHIDALHEHQIKRRTIVPAEDPGLHLVWYYDTVYLKPIPPCFLNHRFWQSYLLPSIQPDFQGDFKTGDLSQECRAALGFLRTYSYLVLHHSDFHIAQEKNLVPRDVSYPAFQNFIKYFRHLPDEVVSSRYHYGQFRLTRLNWAIRLYRPKSTGSQFPRNYQGRPWQYREVVERYVAPLLFIFAIISVALSAMQVVLAASGSYTWASFVQASWAFSVTVLVLSAAIIVSILLGAMGTVLVQGQFALKMHRRSLLATRQPVSV